MTHHARLCAASINDTAHNDGRLYAEEWHKSLDFICKLINKHTKRITVVKEPVARWNSVVLLWESLKRKLNKRGSVNTE